MKTIYSEEQTEKAYVKWMRQKQQQVHQLGWYRFLNETTEIVDVPQNTIIWN